MTAQPTLPGDGLRALTPRQQAAWDLVRQVPAGVTADKVGAYSHERRGKHPADQRCDWCETEGTSILRSKALGPLVIRRRGGRWEPRNLRDAVRPSETRREPTAAELASNPFAGLEYRT